MLPVSEGEPANSTPRLLPAPAAPVTKPQPPDPAPTFDRDPTIHAAATAATVASHCDQSASAPDRVWLIDQHSIVVAPAAAGIATRSTHVHGTTGYRGDAQGGVGVNSIVTTTTTALVASGTADTEVAHAGR